MTLEFVLSNLTDYVDLGVSRLNKKEYNLRELVLNYYMKYGLDDILCDLDLEDVCSYLDAAYSTSDILGYLDSEGIADYYARNFDADELLDKIDRSDLREYLRNNYDCDDFVEMDWRY